jgi:hypothetical protein
MGQQPLEHSISRLGVRSMNSRTIGVADEVMAPETVFDGYKWEWVFRKRSMLRI